MSDPELLSEHLRWPRRTAAAEEDDRRKLGFVRRAGTRWLDPPLLVRSAVQSMVSAAFGRFADRRETQAEIEQPVFVEGTDDEPLWLDFLADTGDGWPATMTMAWLLAQPELRLDGESELLPRADVVLVGGDLVYPAAERAAYEDRFVGPFAGALPYADPVPRMYMIPGNHDWYDGLVAFSRRFLQGPGVGAWRTPQTRSYTALKLPHRWWVWMLDIQLDELVDDAQLKWFDEVASKDLAAGDRVILVTGKPSWVKVSPATPFPPAWENLAYVESLVAKKDARVELVVTGDLHHYARYMPPEGSPEPPRLTSGGGGAYLSPTHTLPERVALRPTRWSDPTVYTEEAVYPDRQRSGRLGWNVLKLARLSPGLGLVVAGIYALLALTMLTAISEDPGPLALTAQRGSVLDFAATAASGTSILLAVLVTAGLWAQLDAPPVPRLLISIVHGIAQVTLCLFAILVVARWIFGAAAPGIAVFTSATVGAAVTGFALGTTLLAAMMLAVSSLWKAHARETGNQVFAAQGLEKHKNWLRMRVDADGLAVYAIGVDEACGSWTVTTDTDAPRTFNPAPGHAPRAKRIDDVLRRR